MRKTFSGSLEVQKALQTVSLCFIKDILGWEEVQLFDMTGIRTMLALGWVAAGFLYELGVTLEWADSVPNWLFTAR
jgi:hypothetical protein